MAVLVCEAPRDRAETSAEHGWIMQREAEQTRALDSADQLGSAVIGARALSERAKLTRQPGELDFEQPGRFARQRAAAPRHLLRQAAIRTTLCDDCFGSGFKRGEEASDALQR